MDFTGADLKILERKEDKKGQGAVVHGPYPTGHCR